MLFGRTALLFVWGLAQLVLGAEDYYKVSIAFPNAAVSIR